MKEVDSLSDLDRPPSPKREIRNLLLAIGAGLLIALCAVAGGAYCHDRRGVYTLANVLLAPHMMGEEATLFDRDPTSHIQREWRFDRIEVTMPDGRHRPLPLSDYRELYDLVAKQRSGPSDPAQFNGGYRLELSLSPTGRYAAAYEPQLFQTVEIAPSGDLFRVELVVDSGERKTATFHKPGVGERVVALLNGEGV